MCECHVLGCRGGYVIPNTPPGLGEGGEVNPRPLLLSSIARLKATQEGWRSYAELSLLSPQHGVHLEMGVPGRVPRNVWSRPQPPSLCQDMHTRFPPTHSLSSPQTYRCASWLRADASVSAMTWECCRRRRSRFSSGKCGAWRRRKEKRGCGGACLPVCFVGDLGRR